MEINPLQHRIDASNIAPEKLAGNPSLTQDQKVAEASRQFEAVLLRQILSDSQKTVIPSELSDNSTAAGIYQDVITNTLADNISKSGAFGLAKTFTQQLNHPDHAHAHAQAAGPAGTAAVRSGHPLLSENPSAPQHRRTATLSVKQP
jgi:Rod binding domain-containing protein